MYYVTKKSQSKHQHKNQHGMKNTTASSTKAPLGVPPTQAYSHPFLSSVRNCYFEFLILITDFLLFIMLPPMESFIL